MAVKWSSVLMVILAVSMIALVRTKGESTLTPVNKTGTVQPHAWKCPYPAFTGCSRFRMAHENALKQCSGDTECDESAKPSCCLTLCAGFRCVPEGYYFIDPYCPKYDQRSLSCKKWEDHCTRDCLCCFEAASCSRQCIN